MTLRFRQAREAVDDAVADPLREVFGVRIAARVDEGQDRHRVYRLAAAFGEVGEIHERRDQEERRR